MWSLIKLLAGGVILYYTLVFGAAMVVIATSV